MKFYHIQSRSQKKRLPFQSQISALIQATNCSTLKFIIAFERRMRESTQFYTHGR